MPRSRQRIDDADREERAGKARRRHAADRPGGAERNRDRSRLVTRLAETPPLSV